MMQAPLKDSFASTPSIESAPINSLILNPSLGDVIDLNDGEDTVTLQGVALSSDGKAITKVEIFIGDRWLPAKLKSKKSPWGRHWTWTSWILEVPKRDLVADHDGKVSFACRAVDEGYNTQPEKQVLWNMRGFLQNSYHTVPIHLISSSDGKGGSYRRHSSIRE